MHRMMNSLFQTDKNKETHMEGRVPNKGGGHSYQACDMQLLQRFIVLGSEQPTYYSTAEQVLVESVLCVKRLLDRNHFNAVLDLIEKFSKEGRVPKEDPILTVLAICANRAETAIRQAAYAKVNSICNIPTKLFRFIELTHKDIERKRIANPPDPQPAKKRKQVSEKLSEMKISEPKKEPVESIDDSGAPPAKKKKKPSPEFKKVNSTPRKSLGWGRMRRKGISKFYSDEKKEASRLLYLLTKYKQRSQWSHKQVLTYSHPKMKGEDSQAKNLVLRYCTRGYEKVEAELNELAAKPGISDVVSEVIAYIKVIHAVSQLSPDTEGDEDKLLDYLKTYGIRTQAKEFISEFPGGEMIENKEGKKSPIQIVREHLPTGFLKSRKVWEALLIDMPMTAMIRNLGKMSSMGMFDEGSPNVDIVKKALNNTKRLQSARVHPMKVLIAMQVYSTGKGDKGSLTWNVNQDIVNALNAAFYKSFRTPEIGQNFKTDKKFMLCLDISGSMTSGGCVGCPTMSPALASVAMAMVTWNIEDDVDLMAFGSSFMDMTSVLKKEMTIEQAMAASQGIRMGGTDCSLPMTYAKEKKKDVDCFIVYTDSETNCNRISPMTALRMYNQDRNRDAKLIVCGMQVNGFTIADPNDRNALDVVGFDAGVPDVMSNFARGDMSMKCNVCEECQVN